MHAAEAEAGAIGEFTRQPGSGDPERHPAIGTAQRDVDRPGPTVERLAGDARLNIVQFERRPIIGIGQEIVERRSLALRRRAEGIERRQAIDSLGIFGTCGIVGATKEGTEVAFNVNNVMIPGRKIVGIVQGDVVAKTFIPTMIELYQQGRFPFDKLVRFYDFADINQAVEDSERGVTIKPILRIGA